MGWGGGEFGRVGGVCQGGCERRIEVFVKIEKKKKYIYFFFGGGGGGGAGGSGWVGRVRVDMNGTKN